MFSDMGRHCSCMCQRPDLIQKISTCIRHTVSESEHGVVEDLCVMLCLLVDEVEGADEKASKLSLPVDADDITKLG